MVIKRKASFNPKSFPPKVGEGRSIGEYHKGQIVFSQGDAADAVFYLQNGKVKFPSFWWCMSKVAPSLPVKPSVGLIVTELVINALKHAFLVDRSDGTVVVAYELAEPNWRLTVSDNGIGQPEGHPNKTNPGLRTTIKALAKQLNACVEVLMNPLGTTVTHAASSP